jgi:hypothetical protein
LEATGAAAAGAAGAEAAGAEATAEATAEPDAEAEAEALGFSPTLHAVRAKASRPTIANDFFICFPSKNMQTIITGNYY